MDDELFRDSYDNIAHRVLGEPVKRKDLKANIKNAIDEVFYYYNYPRVEVPHNITDPLDQIEYAVGTVGMMKANIKLEGKWFSDCFGPIICFFKEDNMPIALFPIGFARYFYYDPDTGKKVRVGKKEAQQFSEDAVAFYEPLPLKKLGIPDLIGFMKRRLTLFDYLSVAVIALILVLFTMILPYASQLLTGTVLDTKNYSLYMALVIAIIVTIFFTTLFDALETAVLARVKWKVTIPVEQAVMQRILTLPATFFRQYSAGELSSRSSSINEICEIIIQDVFAFGFSSAFSLVYLFQIFHYAPRLVVPSVVIMFLTVLFSTISVLMQMGISKRHMELLAKESGLTFAIINGIQKIKLAGAEKRIFAKWANQYAEGAALQYNPPFFLKISGVINTGISLIGTVVLYGIAIKSGVSAPEYFAFNIAYTTMFAAFSQLSSASLSVAKIKPVLEMAEPILKTEPEKTLRKDMVTRISGGIEMNGVYFKYNEQAPYILENFSVKIKAGEYVAIVGKTGCGKSTLVRLLLGFEKPEKGAVFYDGKDLERIDLKSLRRKIGSVIQDGKLFYGDIFRNIAIASEKLTKDEAWEAAEMAGIADDIRAMPMGMNTIIAEGQGGISGGQKQRILIARAVASKPKILIFDEATSALDNITQRQISEALDGLKCTRIVIAHRLSTIKNCDRILVMDGGKIVEEGTYDELIARKGYFSELVERQQL
ncbi:ATP-binding cassette domain-containing protein [Butyrivibrio sp. CB08]|uniref:ATP-binding cassette domain-containing protein n=1 Tax=Butyrivibrio sp. CB08 TaxID=2364879 RepID=UPI001FA94C61|nr:ATP-binding cassette domain-containing protein [Butyrivibrio sp. CB08]